MAQLGLGGALAGTSDAALASRTEPAQALFTKLSPGPGRPPDEVADHQRARIHKAIVEIAGERGYEAVAVRDITRLAGVSSRSFYKHHASKEECFLHTHETIARSLTRSIVAAQAEQVGWRDRLQATFAAFIGELERDLRGARLLLIEAYVAGADSLDQVRRAERTFEARMADCFEGAEEDIEMPPLLIKALTLGMIGLTRSLLLDGREEELPELPKALTRWALSLTCDSAVGLMELDRPTCEPSGPAEAEQAPASKREEIVRQPIGDRALILDAVSKLVAGDGYEGLTVPSICLAAGLSRRRFHLQYEDMDECFVDVAELRLAKTFAAAEGDGPWDRGVHSSLTSICHAIATDRALQRLGFGELLHAGRGGLAVSSRTIDRIRELISAGVSESQLDTRVLDEASASAIWGLLGQLATDVGHWQPSRAGRALAFLALAPVATTGLSGPSG